MLREKRKLDHIRYAIQAGDGNRRTGFEDVHFLHNCLTPVNPEAVDVGTCVGNITLAAPVFIDAITGGTARVKDINRSLARVAKRVGMALAVGSQYGSVRSGEFADSFSVVREEYPEGIIFANISALATPEEAEKAVEMIGASALEIHLNVTQELIMPEGDKNFRAIWENLLRLRQSVAVPVIIKETGCGMGAEQIRELQAAGFTCFNLSGLGGTSFAAIEALRSGNSRHAKFADWGIPTAWSLLDAVHTANRWDTLIASGGIRSGWQAAQALAMGADAVGMSGNVLALLLEQGEEKTVAYLRDVLSDIRDIMVLTGSRTVRELQQAPLVFTGDTLSFIQSRGYDPRFKRNR